MSKGFELQFHWMFVMIAGAIILGFFFAVVTKQREVSNQKLELKISQQLETLLTGGSIAKGTAQKVPIPSVGLSFTCGDPERNECDCTFSVGNYATPYKEKYLFAPAKLSEAELLLWTLDWKLPFRGGNFIYATNTRVVYFFVYEPTKADSNQLATKIMNAIPPELNARKISTTDLPKTKNENNPISQFVFLRTSFDKSTDNPMLLIHETFQNKDTRGVNIRTDGLVTFYRPGSKQGSWIPTTSVYNNDAEMYGAIFAADNGMYNCNLRAAYARMYHVISIYKERLSGIKDTRCKYTAAKELLGRLQSAASTMSNGLGLKEIISSKTEVQGIGAAKVIREIIPELERENKDKLLASCPQVY